MPEPSFRRVIVKLSGEALSGPEPFGIHRPTVEAFAADLIAAHSLGVTLGVVVGGGNVLRGVEISAQGMSRPTGDAMGMLATVMNALVLETALERAGASARTMSALAMPQVCETYERQRALRHLDEKRIVVFAGGTGNPFFTTDTAASLRAIEIGADVLLKATKVNGVYSADPKLDPSATRYDEISFMEVVNRDLRIMDLTAITFCKDNNLPIRVFDLMIPGNVGRALSGEPIGTLVR